MSELGAGATATPRPELAIGKEQPLGPRKGPIPVPQGGGPVGFAAALLISPASGTCWITVYVWRTAPILVDELLTDTSDFSVENRKLQNYIFRACINLVTKVKRPPRIFEHRLNFLL